MALIEALEQLAGRYGIGRGIHLGDTVLGTKGRVAFEAPAAITLITAHRELEKLVLSAQQARTKDSVAATYGDLVHEGKQLDLVCADIEALLASSQRRVSGTVTFTLRPGALFINGVDSPHSPQPAVYTASRPANGRPPTRSGTRAYSPCRARCRPGHREARREIGFRRQGCVGRAAQQPQ